MLATNEFNRFTVLFDRLVGETNLWIERTPPDKPDWLPVDNTNVRFGDRVSRATIKNLYVHIAVADHEAIRQLQSCAEEATLPLPRNPELSKVLAGGDLVAGACGCISGSCARCAGSTRRRFARHCGSPGTSRSGRSWASPLRSSHLPPRRHRHLSASGRCTGA